MIADLIPVAAHSGSGLSNAALITVAPSSGRFGLADGSEVGADEGGNRADSDPGRLNLSGGRSTITAIVKVKAHLNLRGAGQRHPISLSLGAVGSTDGSTAGT